MTREEYIHAEDMGNFFKIPADKKDLNYDKYFVEGNEMLSREKEYNSQNTEQLNAEQIKAKLMQLDYIKEELRVWQTIKEAAVNL